MIFPKGNEPVYKVLLILPYFGEWPEYLDLYFKGCEFNKWLDILFITNCPIPKKHPSNVKFIKSNISLISELISEKFGFLSYKLPFPYKLCDFRPSYGYLFEEHITGYDYWGYGDIDLIYGNLEQKVKYQIEQSFDTISVRAETTCGSFMLIKNNEYNNQLFKKLENFNTLIISDTYEGIDETNHNWAIWHGLAKSDLSKSCFTYLVDNEDSKGKLKASFQTYICEYLSRFDILKYSNGEVYFKEQSFAYFHYVTNKEKSYFRYPKWPIIPNIFYITDTGFYKNLWMATFISPAKKFIYQFFYYLKKAPSFLLKQVIIKP